jgi:8-oxo-dGTP pyrophosphatase MutT (NUDIX family)
MLTTYSLPAYIGIVLQKNKSIFLIQRSNTNWMSGYWNFPGGLLENNESLVMAAIRETQEEIGVIVKPDDFRLAHVIHVHKNRENTQDIFGFYFIAECWEGIPTNNEPNKIIGAQWFNLDYLPFKITGHAKNALYGIKEGVFYSESGW